MADVFVKADGNDTTGDGSVGTPYRTIKKALEVATSDGDRVFVYSNAAGDGAFDEGTISAHYTLVGPALGAGVAVQVFAVTDFNAGSPADSHLVSAAADRAVVDASGGIFNITLGGTADIKLYGLHLQAGNDIIFPFDGNWVIEEGLLELAGTAPGDRIHLTIDLNPNVTWLSTDIKFGGTGQGIDVADRNTLFRWQGGAIDSAGSAPANLLRPGGPGGGVLTIEGVDLTHVGTGNLVDNGLSSIGDETYVIRFVHCDVAAGVSLVDGDLGANAIVTLEQCNTNAGVRRQRNSRSGVTALDTGTFRSGGWVDKWNAADTPASYSMTPVAGCSRVLPLRSFPIHVPITTTGSAVTLTVHAIHDYTSLTKRDAWISVRALTTAAESQSELVEDRTYLDTTALASSTETWTEAITETKIKLTATFTPQIAGSHEVVVNLAQFETAKSFFFCPLVEVS